MCHYCFVIVILLNDCWWWYIFIFFCIAWYSTILMKTVIITRVLRRLWSFVTFFYKRDGWDSSKEYFSFRCSFHYFRLKTHGISCLLLFIELCVPDTELYIFTFIVIMMFLFPIDWFGIIIIEDLFVIEALYYPSKVTVF